MRYAVTIQYHLGDSARTEERIVSRRSAADAMGTARREFTRMHQDTCVIDIVSTAPAPALADE